MTDSPPPAGRFDTPEAPPMSEKCDHCDRPAVVRITKEWALSDGPRRTVARACEMHDPDQPPRLLSVTREPIAPGLGGEVSTDVPAPSFSRAGIHPATHELVTTPPGLEWMRGLKMRRSAAGMWEAADQEEFERRKAATEVVEEYQRHMPAEELPTDGAVFMPSPLAVVWPVWKRMSAGAAAGTDYASNKAFIDAAMSGAGPPLETVGDVLNPNWRPGMVAAEQAYHVVNGTLTPDDPPADAPVEVPAR